MEAALFADALGLGLAGLAVYAFAEKIVPFIPSFAFLIFVGMAAGGQSADVGLSLLAITLGSMSGAVALFLVGRHIDERKIQSFAARFGRYTLLRGDRYDRVVAAYRHRHFLVTLFGQFVPFARNYTAVSAGTVGVAFLPFVIATAIGASVWNASFLMLGYFLGVLG